MLRKVTFILFLVIASFCANAQRADIGIYPFGTYDNLGFDTINVANLNTHFEIPIVTKSGRGLPFNYSIVYDGLVWSNVSVNYDDFWSPDSNFGFHGMLDNAPDGYGQVTGYLSYSITYVPCDDGSNTVQLSNYTYYDAFGRGHLFNYTLTASCDDGSGGGGVSGDGSTSDGTGYRYSPPYVYTKGGVQINAPVVDSGTSGYGSLTDSNGNQVTNSGNGSFVDTTGTTELTLSGAATLSSPLILSYPVSNQADGSTTTQAAVYYKSYTVETNFGCSGITEYGPTSTNLVDHIVLADGSTYSFSYENTPGVSGAVTGRLTSVTLRSSGVITYSYSGSGCSTGINSDGTPVTLTRTTDSGSRIYNRNESALRTDYPGAPCSIEAYYENLSSCSLNSVISEIGDETDYTVLENGVLGGGYVYASSKTVWSGTASAGTQLEQQTTYINGSSGPGFTTSPITYIGTSDTFNGVDPSTTESNFDTSGNPVWVEVSNSSTLNSPITEQITQYTYDANEDLTSETVTDGSGNQLSATQWGYDETTPIATSGIIQHVAAPGARRNLTSTHNWISGNTYLTSTTSYYDTGAAYSTTSPNGTTTYSFDSTQTFVGNTQYPTPTSGASIATSAAFNVTSGIQTSATGLNAGQTVTYGQYDRLLRPTQITTPTSDGGETNITYSPQQVSVLTRMSTSQTADQETFLDAYGRTKRIAIRADLPTIPGQPTPPTQWYITDSCYDAAGRLEYQSVPYESGSNNPSSYQCSTGTGTYYQYDALNRTTFVSHADGSSISFSYLGRAVRSTTSTTPAISRITQYDPLGRIAAVCELSSNATMPNSGSPGACYYFPSGSSSTSSTPMDLAGSGFTTTYSYNGASTTITQGAQSRVFQLDGVGRTVYASEPESGITTYSYTYNSVGLVIIRVRPTANVSSNPSPNPLPTTTTFTDYDSLGRLLGSGSTDGTPERTFSYDTYSGIGAQGYSLGQMTSATVGNTSLPTDQETFYYDIMGRPHETVECFPGWCSAGNTAVRWYGYNFASQLIQEQYGTVLGGGSPATIDYGWGLAGQVSSISGGQSGGSIYTAQSMLPSGPTLVQLGNGLYTPYRYSTAGGLSAGSVCSGSQQVGCTGGQQLYGFSDTVSGMHVTSSADSVLGQQLTYGYDEFGRLTGVSTVANSSSNGVVIGMSFGYDRWGNRATQAMTQGSGPQPSYAFSAATNQITSYSYDVAGNVISDGINNYTYDADNNLTAISGGTTASFFYNALGQRTMATINGVTERYNYNLQGQRATSWNSSGTIDSAQYYAGGGQVGYWSATDSNMHYQHRDFVGTVRARTNAAGSLESTSYSLPYGDALSVSGSDTDPQHFALLDHDGGASSGLEHAAYREYHATSGRWLSPDPYSGSYSLSSPQSMNRYVYALNNPLTMVDPLGLDAEPCETSAEVRSGGATSHDATDTEPGDCSPGDTGDGGDPDAPPSYTLQVNVYEYSTVIYLPWSGNLFLGSSAGSGPDGSTVVAPSNAENPPPCQAKILNATNNQFGTNYTDANVGSTFNYSTGAGPGQGTLNLNITGSTAGVSPGYYPVHWYSYIIGYGPTLHVVSGPGGNGGLDSQMTVPFGPNQGTFHIDSAFPHNPFGAIIHGIMNMTKLAGYPKC